MSTPKIEKPEERITSRISSRLESDNQTSTRNEESSRMIERIKKIIPSQNKEEVKEIEDSYIDTIRNNSKTILIISGVIIVSGLS
jgi:hypothetical protein